MFKKILVPLDGSQLSELALYPALALAKANKAELILMSAIFEGAKIEVDEYYEVPPSSIPSLNSQPMRARMENYLSSMAETRAAIGVPIRAVVAEGEAASCVVETAVSERADLIVMGTHGRSGVSRLLLGSVTQKVWQQAPCPVMAIRGEQPVQNILIPLDPTMLAEHALDPGFIVGGALSAQVHLLIVSHDAALNWEGDSKLPPGETPFSKKLVEDIYQQEGDYLHDLEERYHTKQPITAVRSGDQTDAILAYTKENKIDLVVLTDHSRTGVRRLFQTSNTDKVMRESPSSILVLKSAKIHTTQE